MKIARESHKELQIRRAQKIFIRYESHLLFCAISTSNCGSYRQGYFPVVFAIVAQAMQLNKPETLYAFYYNAKSRRGDERVKLIPLSQMDGQDILFSLRQPIVEAVEQSLQPDLKRLGARLWQAIARHAT